MIDFISLLCEILAMLMVLHKLLRKKFCLNKITVVFLVFEIVLFWLINDNSIPYISQVFIYLAFFLYLWLQFKSEKVVKIIIYTVLSILIVAGTQIMVYMLLFMLQESILRIEISNIIVFCILLCVMRIYDLGKVYTYTLINNRILSILLITCGMVFVLLVLLSKSMDSFSFLNCMLIYIIFLLILVFCQQWKTERDKNLSKEREIRVLKQCNDSFEHLINDVRLKQHDFNNQLELIYSLQYVCNSYDELVRRQNECVSHIIEENHFNKLLASQCSPIVKGFLYYKFCEAYQRGINVEYQVALGDLAKFALEFDIQEIIGLLFDNACEAVDGNGENRNIYIGVVQKDNCVHIQIENPYSYITQSEIQAILKPGYSSKGNNRGYGLSNVKKLTQKYNGTILVENKSKQEQNWISFCVQLIDIV